LSSGGEGGFNFKYSWKQIYATASGLCSAENKA